MKGYKATDKDMKCLGYQFELGKWHEHDGSVIMCEAGFHFCDQPSGPYCYYSEPGTRIFEVEAEDVLDTPFEPGAENKRVCKRIKLVREITPGLVGNDKSNTGDSNTGYRNTGNRNTGNWNTGDSNTGNSNTGYRNTGNRNTGYWNTGDSNTGNSNTGYWNTGNRNTGYWNTGYWNTGNWNTGYWNTGDSNTGYSNATNFSSGFFCLVEPKVVSFDVQTKLTRKKFLEKYPESYELGDLLQRPEPIEIKRFKRIPGITAAKLEKLHAKFLEAKKP